MSSRVCAKFPGHVCNSLLNDLLARDILESESEQQKCLVGGRVGCKQELG